MTARRATIGWMVLLSLTLLLAAPIVVILAVPVDATDFQSATGVDWNFFASNNPDVAQYLRREARLLAVGYLAFSLIVAAITWTGLRIGDHSAWRILWLFPATMWGTSIVFFSGDGQGLGWLYLAAGLIAAAALFSARRGVIDQESQPAGETYDH